MAQRRAVRGGPVPDEDGVESPELGELRRFEEQAFPRAGAGSSFPADGDAIADPAPTAPGTGLPGRWEGSGDVPDVFRAPETTPAPARAVPTPDSDWLRSLALPELPVRWDPQVLRYLDYFRNDPRGHSVMSNWLRRSGRFRASFEAVLEREGLPKDLFYVAMVESGFESSARSRVGAGGIWQFMPGAARAYGLEVSYWVDARRDPERSVEAAARYLKDLYARFGSWYLVFASYNAGYGAVLRSITRYNTNDYWELCHHEAGLPWESSLYVPKILAAAIVGHNLGAFGYADVVPDPPFVYDRVEVPGGTGLSTVARATRTKVEVLAALNPQLLRERVPPDRGKVELRLPVGTAALFAEGFESARVAGDRFDTVTLRFGETLDDVAKARRLSVRELRRLNGVKDGGELRAGVTILVPPGRGRGAGAKEGASGASAEGAGATSGASPSGVARAAGSGADAGDAAAGEDEEILVAVPDRVFNYEGKERVFYRTRDGDTLEEIAETVGVRPEDLVEWNNLDPGARLHPRMVLQIFVRKDFDPAQIVLLDSARVRVVTLGSQEFLELEAARRGKKRLIVEVKAGDTLVRLGRRYGLTTGDLARINRFSYNTELTPGQKVVVYSPLGEAGREWAQGASAAGSDPRRDRSGGGRAGGAKGNDKPRAPTADRSSGKAAPKVGDRANGGLVKGTRAAAPAPVRALATNASSDRGQGGAKDHGHDRTHDRDSERPIDKGAPKTPAKVSLPRPAPKKK